MAPIKSTASDPEYRRERAVSPVIGVILMVAITVILAAVIGVFVMGLGEDLGDGAAPTATLSFEDGEQGTYNFSIEHQSGDSLELDSGDYSILLNGTQEDIGDWGTSELSAGETTEVDFDNDPGVGENSELQLRHEPSNSIIAEGEVNVTTNT